jgi:hypothetical protein
LIRILDIQIFNIGHDLNKQTLARVKLQIGIGSEDEDGVYMEREKKNSSFGNPAWIGHGRRRHRRRQN